MSARQTILSEIETESATYTERLRSAWHSHSAEGAPGIVPKWPASGVAIEGDFKGIQDFVLKPVPGAGGAAKRLRGRSLRVSALALLVANWTREQFAGEDAQIFYLAGGRFLLHAQFSEDWPQKIAEIQSEVDAFLLKEFSGEVVFHLAAALSEGPSIPVSALQDAMNQRRRRPLSTALLGPDGWAEQRFFQPTGPGSFRCPACLRTAVTAVRVEGEEEAICAECSRDKSLGAKLAGSDNPALVESANGEIAFLGRAFTLGNANRESARPDTALEVVHWSPRSASNQVLDFEDLAALSVGWRKWLGYLRVDADYVGLQFLGCQGNPPAVWGLSRLLQYFFCNRVEEIIRARYRTIYPVYGGGDDLCVIGPWDQTLGFASELAQEFAKVTEGKLTLSAGIVSAHPSEHILTKSDEAATALKAAKFAGRARISALGSTMKWDEFRTSLEAAKRIAAWHHDGSVSSALLQNVLALHRQWKELRRAQERWQQTNTGRDFRAPSRYRPLLEYQIARNVMRNPVAAEELRRLLIQPGSLWTFADFLVRYVLLAEPQGARKD